MQTLYVGGDILTMEKEGMAQAILTEKGRIKALGEQTALRRDAPFSNIVDLNGATLMPAFIDAHSHFTQVAVATTQVALYGQDTFEKVKACIDNYIAAHHVQTGGFVIARDYEHNLFSPPRAFTLAELDALAPRHALILQHQSGHMGLLNQRALDALGITPTTNAPKGGRIEMVDGALTGRVEEAALFDCLKRIEAPSLDKLMDAYAAAQELYLKNGVVCAQEGMLTAQMLPMLHALHARGTLRLTLQAYAAPEDYLTAKSAPCFMDAHSNMRLCGVKIFLDGSPQAKTAWMRAPYLGGEDAGYPTMTDAQVMDAMTLANAHQTQLLAHANGDAAIEQFLRCLEKVERVSPALRTLRPVIIHAQFIGADQLELARRLGVLLSFFPAHVHQWGDTHIRQLGLKRASGLSPAASAKRLNIPFTFHQDAPVLPPDMLHTLWCATMRRTRSGVMLGEREKISPMDALLAMTKNAAYQSFLESRAGTLKAGKDADFVILSGNPVNTSPDKLKDIRVLKTIRQGRTLYQAKQ